jgi:hypothetical protein
MTESDSPRCSSSLSVRSEWEINGLVLRHSVNQWQDYWDDIMTSASQLEEEQRKQIRMTPGTKARSRSLRNCQHAHQPWSFVQFRPCSCSFRPIFRLWLHFIVSSHCIFISDPPKLRHTLTDTYIPDPFLFSFFWLRISFAPIPFKFPCRKFDHICAFLSKARLRN